TYAFPEVAGGHQGAEGLTVDLGSIQMFPKTDQHVDAVFPDLVDPEFLPVIVGYAKRNNVDLMVFDNLSTLTPTIEDENAAADWNPFNDLVVALKKEGVACLIVHHAGKADNGAQGYRGSTNINTTLDTTIKLSKPESAGFAKGAVFRVDVEKNRVGSSPVVDG